MAAELAEMRPPPPADEQGEVIAFLAQPSAYGRDGMLVERIDTHGAIIFLVEDRAYKLKRAVRFPYMDFSTVALRKAACEAEVAINRRTAPSIYERAVPVARGPEGLAIDGSGEVVDWLVVMRRFDQDTLLDRMATRGELTAELILALADEVARFHTAAERRDSFGGTRGMAWVLDVNRQGMQQATPDILNSIQVEAIDARCRRELGRLAPLLEGRRLAGFVRHCHGDLHLRNICLVDGRPTLFDAIEFSDEIANIDTFYDLAFLIMDLERRDLRTLANLAFNRYLDTCGDYGGLAALPLFLACRAVVRAHTLAASARAQPVEDARAPLVAEARVSLELAGRSLASEQARVIAVGGLSGTGKSTLGRGLAPLLGNAPGAVIVRSDVTRKRLAGVSAETRLPASAYAPEMDEQVYHSIIAVARDVAAAGRTVIVDAVFARPEQRHAIRRAAASAGSAFAGLWLRASPETLKSRVATRQSDASDAGPEVVEAQLGYDAGAIDWIELDAGGSAAETLGAARGRLI